MDAKKPCPPHGKQGRKSGSLLYWIGFDGVLAG